MKIRQVAVGGVLSVLLALSAFSQAADESQQGGSSRDQATTQSQADTAQPSADQAQTSSGAADQPSQSQQASNQNPSPVKSVQTRLKEEGYYKGKVDGFWGAKSAKALKKYQKHEDIHASGKMDQQTADKLGLSQGEFAAFEETVKQQGGGKESRHHSTSRSDRRNFSNNPKD